MKKLLFIPLLFCALLCIAQNRVTVSPGTPMERAVSGHYAGWVNGELSTYGGCDFPDIPCADGGKKVYYPKAYGASVQVPDGTVYIGGMNATSSLSECQFINAADGASTPITSLPKALASVSIGQTAPMPPAVLNPFKPIAGFGSVGPIWRSSPSRPHWNWTASPGMACCWMWQPP